MKDMQNEGKRECTVDCNKDIGNIVHSCPLHMVYLVHCLILHRYVTGHGKNRYLPLENLANGICLEKKTG